MVGGRSCDDNDEWHKDGKLLLLFIICQLLLCPPPHLDEDETESCRCIDMDNDVTLDVVDRSSELL